MGYLSTRYLTQPGHRVHSLLIDIVDDAEDEGIEARMIVKLVDDDNPGLLLASESDSGSDSGIHSASVIDTDSDNDLDSDIDLDSDVDSASAIDADSDIRSD